MPEGKKRGGNHGHRRVIRDQRRSFSGRLDELTEALTEDFGTDPGPVEMALIETAARRSEPRSCRRSCGTASPSMTTPWSG
jgi:hypothetical protein